MLVYNARIITPEEVITGGALEIEKRQITALHRRKPDSGNFDQVLDAAGQYLMPGIIDAHSHIGISSVNEATNPVTAEVWVGDVLNPYDINIYRALAGGVTVWNIQSADRAVSDMVVAVSCMPLAASATLPAMLRTDWSRPAAISAIFLSWAILFSSR